MTRKSLGASTLGSCLVAFVRPVIAFGQNLLLLLLVFAPEAAFLCSLFDKDPDAQPRQSPSPNDEQLRLHESSV
jgi:hypothetical protein